MAYSLEVSLELARSWSAASQRLDSICSMFCSEFPVMVVVVYLALAEPSLADLRSTPAVAVLVCWFLTHGLTLGCAIFPDCGVLRWPAPNMPVKCISSGSNNTGGYAPSIRRRSAQAGCTLVAQVNPETAELGFAWRGKRTSKVVPCSLDEHTSIEPPCASAIFRAM